MHRYEMPLSICASYELTTINKGTRSIHTYIHITDMCPWTNMPTTLDIHVPLLLKSTYRHHTNEIAHICHKCKLPDMHQWGMNANICATYELTSLNHMTRSTVYRWQQWQCSPTAYAEFATRPNQPSIKLKNCIPHNTAHTNKIFCQNQNVTLEIKILQTT